MSGIYAVKTEAGRVWIVIAESTDEAVQMVIWRSAQELQINEDNYSADDYEVGRLGDYEPGNTGQLIAINAGGVFG